MSSACHDQCLSFCSLVIDCSTLNITNFSVNWNQKSNKVTIKWTPVVLNGTSKVSTASKVAKVHPWCKDWRYEVRVLEWKDPQLIPDNMQNATKVVLDEWSQRSKRHWLRRRHTKKQLTAKFSVLPEKFYTFSVVIGFAKTFQEQPVAIRVSRLLFTGAQGESCAIGVCLSLCTQVSYCLVWLKLTTIIQYDSSLSCPVIA